MNNPALRQEACAIMKTGLQGRFNLRKTSKLANRVTSGRLPKLQTRFIWGLKKENCELWTAVSFPFCFQEKQERKKERWIFYFSSFSLLTYWHWEQIMICSSSTSCQSNRMQSKKSNGKRPRSRTNTKKQQPRAEKAIEREEAINPINPERRIKMTNVPFFPSPKTFHCIRKYSYTGTKSCDQHFYSMTDARPQRVKGRKVSRA